MAQHKRRKLTYAERKARKEARAAKRQAAKMRSPEEAAALFGCGKNQMYEALKRGDIKGAIRFGRIWRIPDAVIQRMISGDAAAPAA
jgi:excisionase family DNA binding protein